MISIGITGSYAVGKSSILNILKKQGYSTFIADEVVHKFYQEPKFKEQIAKFYPDFINFNKVKIANLFFTDSQFKKKITSLIYPHVEEQLENFIRKNSHEEIIFSEIPLLLEAEFEIYFDYIVTIYCSEKIRLIRARNKLNFSFKRFNQIKKEQLPQLKKIEHAHFTINTDVNLLELAAKINKLIGRIKCQSSEK